MSRKEDLIETVIEELDSTILRPKNDHCASIAKAIDNEIGVDEFVGVIHEPDDPLLGDRLTREDLLAHVAVKVNGTIYDGSQKYQSKEDFVRSCVPDRKLQSDIDVHFWAGSELADTPSKKDYTKVEKVVQNAV